jgi:hypothetical protein
MFQQATPWFLGMILGECLAVGLWIAISMVMAALGIPYKSVQIMPI